MNRKIRNKLHRFTEFANTLLPHEAQYLQLVHQFKDPENVSILGKIRHYSQHIKEPRNFDQGIDKRKYSNLKEWINRKLNALDADIFFSWLIQLDHHIMIDSINPVDEAELIRSIRRFIFPGYYFIRFYELVQNYRSYLLIRMRHDYYRITGDFLEKYRENYLRSKQINQQLHEATIDIVGQYAMPGQESKQWEEWLISVFKDDTLDGLNRYYAIVRLTFLYYNYREYSKLIDLYNELDRMIISGEIYSRRILVNYYANRLMVHSRYNEMDKAEHYGFLSIRHKGADYLQYLNNLCAVLLRVRKYDEALRLMQQSFADLKNTISPHNRIGFAAYFMQCLNKCGRAKEAYSYGKTFLDVHREDILQYRWHLFFTSLMQSMTMLEKYREILGLAHKYKLPEKELIHRKRAGYIPSFIWYHTIARYMELEINEEQLRYMLKSAVQVCQTDAHKMRLIHDLAEETGKLIPFIGQITFDME